VRPVENSLFAVTEAESESEASDMYGQYCALRQLKLEEHNNFSSPIKKTEAFYLRQESGCKQWRSVCLLLFVGFMLGLL
jgi:hypothetical protein